MRTGRRAYGARPEREGVRASTTASRLVALVLTLAVALAVLEILAFVAQLALGPFAPLLAVLVIVGAILVVIDYLE